jgi:hypothetical protein
MIKLPELSIPRTTELCMPSEALEAKGDGSTFEPQKMQISFSCAFSQIYFFQSDP